MNSLAASSDLRPSLLFTTPASALVYGERANASRNFFVWPAPAFQPVDCAVAGAWVVAVFFGAGAARRFAVAAVERAWAALILGMRGLKPKPI
jgi:hypothetical protein